jgi:hypothetical protein
MPVGGLTDGLLFPPKNPTSNAFGADVVTPFATIDADEAFVRPLDASTVDVIAAPWYATTTAAALCFEENVHLYDDGSDDVAIR